MTITIKHEGVLRPITGIKVMYGGTLRTIRSVKVMEGDTLRTVALFAPPISLSVSPSSSFASVTSASVVAVTTRNVTAFVTGGTAPFSYSWAQTSGQPASIYSPTNATTKFSMALGPGSDEDAQFTCTVTDSLGLTASAVAFVNFRNNSGA